MAKNNKDSGGGCITGIIYLIIIAFIISNWHIIIACICVLISIWIICKVLGKIPKEKDKSAYEKSFHHKENNDSRKQESDKHKEKYSPEYIEYYARMCNAQLEHDREMREYMEYYNIKDIREKDEENGKSAD